MPSLCRATVYRYSAASLNAIARLADQPLSGSGFSALFPAGCITLFVIAPSGGDAILTITKTGNGSGTVTTTASATRCNWTAPSAVPWVTLSATSDTGRATLRYTVARNSTGANRTGILTIAGKTFTIVQTK